MPELGFEFQKLFSFYHTKPVAPRATLTPKNKCVERKSGFGSVKHAIRLNTQHIQRGVRLVSCFQTLSSTLLLLWPRWPGMSWGVLQKGPKSPELLNPHLSARPHTSLTFHGSHWQSTFTTLKPGLNYRVFIIHFSHMY